MKLLEWSLTDFQDFRDEKNLVGRDYKMETFVVKVVTESDWVGIAEITFAQKSLRWANWPQNLLLWGWGCERRVADHTQLT